MEEGTEYVRGEMEGLCTCTASPDVGEVPIRPYRGGEEGLGECEGGTGDMCMGDSEW